MDRFLGVATNWEKLNQLFKIQYGQIYRTGLSLLNRQHPTLKSNMDRFIGTCLYANRTRILSLKSNMDRFIEVRYILSYLLFFTLKSNMDRFIDGVTESTPKNILLFKIQYGQIYSELIDILLPVVVDFKIQYGQIYRNRV